MESLTIPLVGQKLGVATVVADSAHVLQGGCVIRRGPAAEPLDDEEVLRRGLS